MTRDTAPGSYADLATAELSAEAGGHEVPGPGGVPIPHWWRSAPELVADCLADLPRISPTTPVHTAVRDYCAVAAHLYTARAHARTGRLRPSASLELEPGRLLFAHAANTGWTAEALFHCGADDLTAAVRTASAALLAGPARDAVVLQVTCGQGDLRVRALHIAGPPPVPDPFSARWTSLEHVRRRLVEQPPGKVLRVI